MSNYLGPLDPGTAFVFEDSIGVVIDPLIVERMRLLLLRRFVNHFGQRRFDVVKDYLSLQEILRRSRGMCVGWRFEFWQD